MKFNTALVITILYLVFAFVLLVLMGMEIISNKTVVDRLLITIPITGVVLCGYWFSKKGNGGPTPP